MDVQRSVTTMATKGRSVVSDKLVPPGEVLGEEIEARGLTQTDLARSMGSSLQAVNALILGKKAVTADTALRLEKVLGISAEFWMRLEIRYRLAMARAKAAAA